MRREYADLIFRLWARHGGVRRRIDRDHEDTISIEDLHLFFGDEISVEEIEAGDPADLRAHKGAAERAGPGADHEHEGGRGGAK